MTTARADGARRLIIAGASPDTGNLGVSALHESIVCEMASRIPNAELTILDYGRGLRSSSVVGADGVVPTRRLGASYTKRIYRPESWYRIRFDAHFGGLGNASARGLLDATTVLDVSGGDSFTDLYGAWRFRNVCQPKWMALRHGTPLILMPQTYGPFRTDACRRAAAAIVRRSELAWARDARSFDELKGLLGDAFDPEKHRAGVDVAFLLHPRAPVRPLPQPLGAWLDASDDVPVIGLNVSGLLVNDPVGARARFGLRADYTDAVCRLVASLMARTDARIILLPHVLTPPGHYESDHDACLRVVESVKDGDRGRIGIVPPDYEAGEMKWIISRTAWFCGTRMHATIAALSTGTPVAAISYSPKTLGVFETCGQGEHVADPRALDTVELVERLLASWEARKAARVSLRERLPQVLETARHQFDLIAERCVAVARRPAR